MRRNDEEFKAEVMKRCTEYRESQQKKRKTLILTCVPLALCLTAVFALTAFPKVMYRDNAPVEGATAEDGDQLYEEPGEIFVGVERANQESIPQAESTAYTVRVDIRTDPEHKEFERTYTDPQKIAEAIDYINSAYSEETQPSEELTRFIITVTDSQGNAADYSYFSDEYPADYSEEYVEYYNNTDDLIGLIERLPSD